MTTLEGDERYARVADAYPSAMLDLTSADTTRVVEGEEFIARLLRDTLSIDNVEVRRGQRPRLDADQGRQLLNDLRGLDYTVDPFHIALRVLIGPRSLANTARRTGLSKPNLSRLLNRQKTPSRPELEACATGFGKQPFYFAEYRTIAFMELVRDTLAADPDRSAALAHQYGLGRG